MKNQNYLIFDVGASNGRALVAQFDGNKFYLDEIYRFDNIPVFAAKTLFWDILKIYSDLKNGISNAIKKYKNIKSLALTTWGVDFSFIDKNGQLISNPIHYRDLERTKMYCKIYEDIISDKELFKLVGGPISSIGSINQIYLMKLREATELKNAYKFFMISDLLNYFLTMEMINEFTIATTTTMFNISEKKWEEILFKKLDINTNIFSKIMLPGKMIGNIYGKVSDELGIKTNTPIKVISAPSHDTASAVAGIPILRNNKKWAFLSMGTWFAFGIITKEKIVTDMAFNEKFYNEGSADGNNLFIKNMTGLWVLQQCRNKWVKDLNKKISWDEIMNLASNSKPFRCFINTDDASFITPSENMPLIIKRFCESAKQYSPENIGEIARCIYESMVFKLKYSVNILEDIINEKIENFYFVGGGTKDKILCQWMANATGKPILAGPVESASVGNLIFQLKISGQINSIEEGKIICKNSSKLYIYEPKETDAWKFAYLKFLNIVK